MKVELAQSAGFCWGVRRAVELAQKTAAIEQKPIYTDGPLIHNEQLIACLEQAGIQTCSDPSTLGAGSTLLIRAHGIAPSRQAQLATYPISLVDATCPDVAKIHRIIQKASDAGRVVLILGDPGHAEVVGLLGCAGARGQVVRAPSDVMALSLDLGPVTLVSQSTQSEATFLAVAEAVQARYPGAEIVNTICRATRARQGELAQLAETCEAFVVVGSAASANTQRLAQLAQALRPTFVVSTHEALPMAELARYSRVAVTAGASTPDFLIQAVIQRLQCVDTATCDERNE